MSKNFGKNIHSDLTFLTFKFNICGIIHHVIFLVYFVNLEIKEKYRTALHVY